MFPAIELTQLPSVLLTQRHQLPECSAIYFAMDATDRVLYIGQAVNLYVRWQGKGHHRLPQLLRLHKKSPVRLAWLDCGATLLTSMETYYIALYDPLLNRTKVPESKIIPAEVMLQQTLHKVAKYSLIFGIAPAQGKTPPIVNLRYIGWRREVHNIRRIFQAANRRGSGLRWTETSRRKYGAWWRTRCNGVQLELGPWGSDDRDDLLSRSVVRKLAGVELPALTQLVLQEMIGRSPYLGENFPGIQALEADPIVLRWQG